MPNILWNATCSRTGGELGAVSTPARSRGARATHSPDLTKAEVAELSMADIYRMSRGELAAAIRGVNVRLLREDVAARLQFYDRATLEQLAFLARRTVRNQGY